MRRTLFAALALTLSLTLSAQQNRLELTVDTIMRGYGLSGYAPKSVRWSRDGQQVFFEWKQYSDPTEENFDTYVVGRDAKGLRKLSEEEAKHATPNNARWTRDRRRAVFVVNGDVFLYDAAAKRRRALTDTTDAESNARFTHDEKGVTFRRGNNLFVVSLGDGSVEQKTNIVGAAEKGAHVTLFEDEHKDRTESQKWIAEEAKKLSDVVARREAERKEEEGKRKGELALAPMKLESGQSVADLQLTPDGRYVIAFVTVEAKQAKEPVVPSYVTASGYTADLPARTKVGDAQEASRVAILSTADGKAQWLKHGLKAADRTTEHTETTERTEQTATTEKSETKEVPEREVELAGLFWSEDGSRGVLPVRAADNKDWWLLAIDPVTATSRVLFHEHDPAWVHWLSEGNAGFVPATGNVWFISERTGWLHLYTVPFAGGEPRALTSGKYEVDDVRLSDDGKSFYLTTSQESLYERHLYRLPVNGGALTKLTTTAGWHNAVPSPDGTTLADVYSYTNKPAELYVGSTRATTSPAPEFATYPWLDVPIVNVPARDGAQVPARIYKPANWNGGPAVIFVHGAGYLQNVHRGWSNYFREYMFHHLLMERGYLVLDLDFRASSGYGRDWRTAIYRHMGGVDLNDHVDAAQWLVREQRVDAKRIGIYGGSYGGFITLMALFTTPDVFAAGAALRPVTDWAHYNHGYTSNILNTPQSDPEAYRKSSPIYFADGLKNALLICHGVIDVNVHFQDTVRLVQRLIELRKENWEAAMYPLEDHTFVEPTSWADEYKRVLALFERELK
ncbi:MAG TPA: prolyl oligopeptidase family serine peptidase [Thermoanaerobaculia bacterium]|nr:prolyl oligopeptidase family serine peptidase [Thermoanaerobaculia bacterium]